MTLSKKSKIKYIMKGLKVLQYCEKNPDPILPVKIVQKVLEKRHITNQAFSDCLNLTPEEKKDFWEGKIPITEEIAFALEDFLDIPRADFWLKLEEIYQRRK